MSGGKIERKVMRAVITGATIVTVTAATLAAETHKEFHFNVGPKAGVSVNNPYGSISVKPATSNVVTVNAVYSDKVQVEDNLVGNRVEVQSLLMPGADAQSGKVDYEILVPADASITLHSSNGILHAERLRGDVTLEGAGATVDVRDISDAHVHVKTLNGSVKLTNVQDGHVEVDSLSGTVTLTSVVGPLVQVISTSGEIVYIGDFGDRGLYRLTSHSGDIDVTVPDSTSADVNAQTVRGEVHDDIHLQPNQHSSFVAREGNALLGSIGHAASVVKSTSENAPQNKRKEIRTVEQEEFRQDGEGEEAPCWQCAFAAKGFIQRRFSGRIHGCRQDQCRPGAWQTAELGV